jgi:hypothetical protein
MSKPTFTSYMIISLIISLLAITSCRKTKIQVAIPSDIKQESPIATIDGKGDVPIWTVTKVNKSDTSQQPIVFSPLFKDGKIWVSYNGNIYLCFTHETTIEWTGGPLSLKYIVYEKPHVEYIYCAKATMIDPSFPPGKERKQ